MERLIASVRKNPCLWNTEVAEYKLNVVKEAAWKEVIKECELPDVKEAKHLWRKLRDGHRQAVSRKKTGQSTNPNNIWKYEKKMEFLLPIMRNRSKSINLEKQDSNQQNRDVTQHKEDSCESDQHERVDNFVRPNKKPNLTSPTQKRRGIRSAERDPLRRQPPSRTSENTSIVENTAIGKFFMSMLLTTNKLPERLQLRVQREVFNIVMEAQEEVIGTRRSSASPANMSSASTASSGVDFIKLDSP